MKMMHRLTTNRALILPPSPLTAITAVKTAPLLRLNRPLRSLRSTRTLVMDRHSRSAATSSSSGIDTTDASPLNKTGEANSKTHREKKILPPELSRSVVKLTCDSTAEGGVCDVYLIGTAHVSKESCQEVQAVINFLKPEVVFLELCSGRAHVLMAREMKVPTTREMLGMLRNTQNPFGILYSWFLAKVARSLEVFPGAEFRVAYEEALKYGGKVMLGDRPVQITLRRTWGKMPLRHKTKLLYHLLFQSIFLPSPKVVTKMIHVSLITENCQQAQFSRGSCWKGAFTRNSEELEAAY